MTIIYNPKDGAPITQFIYEGYQIDPHYPDGMQMPDGKISKGLVQYEDSIAETLLETYMFLQQLTPEQAKAILERPSEPRFPCDFEGCDYKTTVKMALMQHQKKHNKGLSDSGTPALPTDLIPVAKGSKILSLAEKRRMQDNMNNGVDIANGSDKDGVEWYGEGVAVENNSAATFNGVRKPGQGHFVG